MDDAVLDAAIRRPSIRSVMRAESSVGLLDGAARDAADEAVQKEVIGDGHRHARNQRRAHQLAPVEDVAAHKFDACRKAGADAVVDPRSCDVVEAMLDLTSGAGVDVVIDYVSAASTLEAGARALGRHGRLVTLGGAGQPFRVSAREMLYKEQDLLGSRYVTRAEILETCDIVARGEVWPLVTDIRPLEQAEAVHERLEKGEVTGRAALRIAE